VCKVSLHGSGDWRYGFTEEYAKGRYVPQHDGGPGVTREVPLPRHVEGLPELPERIIRQWRRPERESFGYITAIRLVVPFLCCTRPGGQRSTKKKPIEYIALPQDSNLMVTFNVIISGRDDRLGYPFPGPPTMSHCPVGNFPLGDDETLWVIAGVDPLMQNLMEPSASELDKLLVLDGGRFLLDHPIDARLTCFGYVEDEHNTPYMMDMDPLVTVAVRLRSLEENNDPPDDERARLETFGKEFSRRRQLALTELRSA
jgi:hypothetical protein